MFGKIIYYDKKTMAEYKSIINGKPYLEIEEYDVSNDRGINADLKLVSADVKASKSYKARVQESDLYDCDQFEKVLAGRDDYYDFTISSDFDITTVPNRSIIKMDGFIEIPEDFDIVKMIETFKPFIMGMDQLQDMEETSKLALQTFLGSANAAKIPLVFEGEGVLLCSKVLQENLTISYEDLSEVEDTVTVLARVTSSFVNSSKPYYDPLKDFMSLNRITTERDDYITYYANKKFVVDETSVFFSLVYSGLLDIEYVLDLQFVFLQVPGYKFTIKHFERETNNAGWLIDSFKKISNKEKEEYLHYIYRQKI